MISNLFYYNLRFSVLTCLLVFYLEYLNGQVDTVSIMEKIKTDYAIAVKLHDESKYNESYIYLLTFRSQNILKYANNF